MAKYPISFPSAAMVVPDGEREAVGRDAHAVIDEAKPPAYMSSAAVSTKRPAGARLGRWHVLRRRILVGASAQWRLHGARTTLSRRGYRVGRAHREGLPLPPRATSVRVRSRFLRSMVPLSLVPAEQPNNALEPTPVSAFSSAFAVDITSPAWLSLSRSPENLPRKASMETTRYRTRRPLRTTFTARS